jgi:tetratricopeptide (TPR) repeat protein
MNELDIAIADYKSGDLKKAETDCRTVLSRYPDHPMALHLMAQICGDDNRPDEAHSYREAAVRIENPDPTAYNFLGRSFWDRGDIDRAIDSFDSAVNLRFTHPAALDNLATALAARGKPDDRFTVTIVTPTMGNHYLAQAIAGVQVQSYPNIEHLIVSDGPNAESATRKMIPSSPRHPVHLMTLPYNTGANAFNGHRIYGAAMHLANGRYISFLDDDNWFEPDHIASLMAAITTQGLQWAYAMRNIVDPDGVKLAQDNCSSLGRWPIWHDSKKYLVDTNCYLIRRDIAVTHSPLWFRRYRDEIPPDYALCRALLDNHPKFDCTGLFSVNYRVENSPLSMKREFYLEGNAAMEQRYPDGFPWTRKPADS